MRLINVKTLKFEEFHHDIPPYAILSHTWGHEEVTFQDYLLVIDPYSNPSAHIRVSVIKKKAGFAKIMGACRRAHDDKLGYLWCDTNCIDKRSSAELTEAINSMYAWYYNSAICYAYLADVAVFDTTDRGAKEFKNSRWFTRGWTLQELLAPKEVLFFSKGWEPIGARRHLAEIIRGVTRIHASALLDRSTIRDYSIAQRMSWAANRQTSKLEDIAYCLLGIFDINMPLLYGEGSKAFMRLQEEIIKESDDHSILAWDFPGRQQHSPSGVLATSPNNFSSCGSIVRPMNSIGSVRSPYSKTNLGISLELPMIRTHISGTVLVELNCSVELDEYPSHTVTRAVRSNWRSPVWIWLRSLGHSVYTRSPIPVSRSFLTSWYPEAVTCSVTKFFGITKPPGPQAWVPSIYSSAQSCGAASIGFLVTISFGSIKRRTGYFDVAYLPGDFIVHEIPPRGSPALSHEIILAGNYVVLLSIAWSHLNQLAYRGHAVFKNSDKATLEVMSANDWEILFLNQGGPDAERDNYVGRIKYIYDYIRRITGQSAIGREDSTAPCVQMEEVLRQDNEGYVKVVVHLTFQEATKLQYMS